MSAPLHNAGRQPPRPGHAGRDRRGHPSAAWLTAQRPVRLQSSAHGRSAARSKSRTASSWLGRRSRHTGRWIPYPGQLLPGQTFYEGPDDVHIVAREASHTAPATIVVFFVKDKGAPIRASPQ